jgi:predicted dehydrogenase
MHLDMTVAAMDAGAHVSVQKPMAMTLAECDAMIAAANRTGRRLKVFENFVFYPPLVKAREHLLSGEIGDPKHFRMKVVMGNAAVSGWEVPKATNTWRDSLNAKGLGGPLVFDHGHHMMAVALWLFGDIKDCYAQIEETSVPGEFAQDAPATLVWRHEQPPIHAMWDVSLALNLKVRTDYYAVHEQFEIQGDRGVITINRCSDRMFDEPVLSLYRDGEVRAWHNIEDDWGAGFRLSTRHFVDVLKGREPQQILTGQEGRRVVELFRLFERSSREQRLVSRRGTKPS